MRKLIVVRHSQSQPQPGSHPSQWPLSAAGWRRCRKLVSALSSYNPSVVISSEEVKAKQTAQLLAQAFSIPHKTEFSLHEHERTGVPFLDKEQFHSMMHRFFRQPESLIFGNETAAEALQRFQAAIETVTATFSTGNLIVVSHGTVLSLFVAHHTGQDPFRIWNQLDQPAYAVFDHPSFTLAETVFTV